MESTKKFSDLGRTGAIRELYKGSGFRPCRNPWFECSGGFAVTCSCMMMEGIDFDLTFFPFRHLGYKAVLRATGELFSTLSTPVVLKATIAVSSKLDLPEVSEIWSGICGAAKDYGYADVALDLVPSLTGLCINIAATGLDDGKARRPIAKSMDLICLSNNVGASFLGEQVLRSNKDTDPAGRTKTLEQYRQLVGAYLKPELQPDLLKMLRDSSITPSFGYFCTESLTETLRSLSAASGLGVKIYVDRIPLAGGSVDAAKMLGIDPLQAALKGGDDCCMLFTIPIGSHERFRHDFQSWDIIGHLAKSEVGMTLVSPDGLEHSL